MKPSYTELEEQVTNLKEELHITNEILDSILDPVFVKNDDFIYTFCNMAFTKYLGLPKEKIINSSVFDIAPKELADIYNAADCKIKENPEIQEYEYKVKYSDGTLHDVVFHKSPIIRNSKFRGITGIMFDITEKKKNEQLISEYLENFKENEEKFTVAFNKSPYVKLITRVSDGKIINVNEMFSQLSGYSYEEAINKTTFDLNLWVDTNLRNSIISTLQKGDSIKDLEIQFRSKNNDIRTALLSAGVISVHNETLILTSLIDITQLKNTELALRESQAFYKLVSDYSLNWEAYRNIKGELIYCSPVVENILGYTVEEYSNRIKLIDFVHSEDYAHVISAFTRTLAGERIPSIVFRVVKKNKEIVWLESSGQPVFSEAGEFLGSRMSTRDITHLKNIERALEELNATKDKFFSIIAHDLKSPFQGLMGYSEILSSEYETLTKEEKNEFIDNIYTLSKDAYKLLENLLTWSRMQGGTMTYAPKNILLLEELLPTISLLKQTALNKQIDVEYSIDNSIVVAADGEMLSTIVRNLVSNSIKFTKPGGKIQIAAVNQGKYVQISIRDTGIGMEKEIVNKLFYLTTNTSTKGTADESGTGLGLILCKEMVEKHGGTISVESEPGIGSTFKFTLQIH